MSMDGYEEAALVGKSMLNIHKVLSRDRRAGRDGKQARCVLCESELYAQKLSDHYLNQSTPSRTRKFYTN